MLGIIGFAGGGELRAKFDRGKVIDGSRNHKFTAYAEPKNKADVDIYALIIGVANYPYKDKLNYTDDDAYRLYAHLRSVEGGAVAESHIALLVDEDATRENALFELKEIAALADENDIIYVMLNGHGVPGAFVPYDQRNPNVKLTYDELSALLERSDAAQKVLFVDACYSGSIHQTKGSAKADMTRYYDQLAQSRRGVAMLTSSADHEVSVEINTLRGGVFCHYLIEGIRGAADRNGDRLVTFGELADYTKLQVVQRTNGKQHPLALGNYDANLPVAMVR